MLIAPAGFGKTESASDAFGVAAHWIYFPEDGVTVETIARLVIEKVSPRSMRALSAYLARPQTEENRDHLADWCSSRLRSVELPVVFEDFQRLRADTANLRFVQHLIDATVPSVRWVIISRETPELPVGTWLARDYMSLPVTAEDLAFEVTEGAAVANALNVAIDAASIQELVTMLRPRWLHDYHWCGSALVRFHLCEFEPDGFYLNLLRTRFGRSYQLMISASVRPRHSLATSGRGFLAQQDFPNRD